MHSVTRIAMFLSLSALAASARLVSGSLKPSGGESFKPGEVMTIEWVASQADNGKYDLYFSKDGGKSWSIEFAEAWQGSTVDNAKNTYKWTIPANINTTQGRIRVCQMSGGHCVQVGGYTLVSQDFTVSNSNAVAPAAPEAAAPQFAFSPQAGSLEVEFDLPEAGQVTLDAIDAAGQRVAGLLDRRLEGGPHRLSMSSHRLQAAGPLFFHLTRGDRTSVWKAGP